MQISAEDQRMTLSMQYPRGDIKLGDLEPRDWARRGKQACAAVLAGFASSDSRFGRLNAFSRHRKSEVGREWDDPEVSLEWRDPQSLGRLRRRKTLDKHAQADDGSSHFLVICVSNLCSSQS